MTELFLIRHGETDWNKDSRVQGISDIPLNENGRNQAIAAAEILAKGRWDLIWSSPLKRAHETARIISNAIGVPDIRTENDLVEFDFGEAEGMDLRARKIKFPDRSMIPGAEKTEGFRSRIKRVLTSITAEHQNSRIIAVSHACLIMEALEIFSCGGIDGRKIRFVNLSVSLILLDSEWRIPWYNRPAEWLEKNLFLSD